MDLPRAALMSYGRVCPVRHSLASISACRRSDAVVVRTCTDGAHARAAE